MISHERDRSNSGTDDHRLAKVCAKVMQVDSANLPESLPTDRAPCPIAGEASERPAADTGKNNMPPTSSEQVSNSVSKICAERRQVDSFSLPKSPPKEIIPRFTLEGVSNGPAKTCKKKDSDWRPKSFGQDDDVLARILGERKPIDIPDLATFLPKYTAPSSIFEEMSKGPTKTRKSEDNDWRPKSFGQDDDVIARILRERQEMNLPDLSTILPKDTVTRPIAAETTNGAATTHKNENGSLASLILAVAIGIAGALYYAAKPSKNEPERPAPTKVDPAP